MKTEEDQLLTEIALQDQITTRSSRIILIQISFQAWSHDCQRTHHKKRLQRTVSMI